MLRDRKNMNMSLTKFRRISTSAVDSDQLEHRQQATSGSKTLVGDFGGRILAAGTISMKEMIRKMRLFCHGQ